MQKISEIYGKRTLICKDCGFKMINVSVQDYKDCGKCGGEVFIKRPPKPKQRHCTVEGCGKKLDIEPSPFSNKWIVMKCQCVIDDYNKSVLETKKKTQSNIPTETDRLNFDIMEGRHGESEIDNFNLKDASESVRMAYQSSVDYIEILKNHKHNGKGLFFLGIKKTAKSFTSAKDNYGTGKTHLITAICKSVKNSVIITSGNYLQELRNTYEKGDGYEKIMTTVHRCPLLAIDDIGSEINLTAWGLEKFWEIINHRYNHKLPTCLSSNLTWIGIAEHFRSIDEPSAKRIMSRLVEMTDVIQLEGKDYRRKNTK